jgi:hypothetical protein
VAGGKDVTVQHVVSFRAAKVPFLSPAAVPAYSRRVPAGQTLTRVTGAVQARTGATGLIGISAVILWHVTAA